MQSDVLSFRAAYTPERIAITELHSREKRTFREFDLETGRYVTLLRNQGLSAGDRLAFIGKNSISLLALWLACSRIGVLFVPLNWRLSANELEAQLGDCAPILLVCDNFTEPSWPHSQIWSLADINAAAKLLPYTPCEPSLDANRLSVMLYTSGSTGQSKGVVLTEANVEATANNFTMVAEIDAQCRFLCDIPMFHLMGLIATVRSVLNAGGTLFISEGFEAEKTLRRLGDKSLCITHYLCVPQMSQALVGCEKFDPVALSDLKGIFSGGAPIPDKQVERWLDAGIPIINGYGMTETGTISGMPLNLCLIQARKRSAGLLPPSVECVIKDDTGNLLSSGDEGEIWVRGPSVATGYWNNPEESARSFTDDGWFRTGDIGSFDDAGYLTVSGRKKDMYISGGENVFCAEIENILQGMDGISSVAVTGVADQRWGETGAALLVATQGTMIDVSSVEQYCRVHLASYKVPKYFFVVSDLPLIGTGKINRRAIAQLASKLANIGDSASGKLTLHEGIE